MKNIDITHNDEDLTLKSITEMLKPVGVTKTTLCEDGEHRDMINLHFGEKGTVSVVLDHLYNKRIMFLPEWVHNEN